MLTFIHPKAVTRFLKTHNLRNFSPSLDFLKSLARLFQKMPYENLTKLIRYHSISDQQARLRLPELLFEEYLQFGTGGTCFSMTYFMQTILRSCGYKTYPVIADRPLSPNTHCLSVVIIDNKKYIVDPGFLIDEPIEIKAGKSRYELRHNTIILGQRSFIKIPEKQMLHFTGKIKDNNIILPYENEPLNNEYTIATIMHNKLTIRYFFKDLALDAEQFLFFWQDSFNWPTLRNLSISTATDSGYTYSRNNFMRKNSAEGRKQIKIKKEIDITLGKEFNIAPDIIKHAFEILGGTHARRNSTS